MALFKRSNADVEEDVQAEWDAALADEAHNEFEPIFGGAALDNHASSSAAEAEDDYYDYRDRKHNVHADRITEEALSAEAEAGAVLPAGATAAASDGVPSAGKGRHAKHEPTKKELEEAMPEYHKRSKRMRRFLIVIVVLLVLLLVALAVLGRQLLQTSQDLAEQQVNQTTVETEQVAAGATDAMDASANHEKVTSVPDLVGALGLTQEEALAHLGHGATVTLETPNPNVENPAASTTSVTVMLTDEPAEMHTGTPSVYLTLNADGVIISAGYSAAASSLGYGSLSFADAVTNEHVIEKTLNDAGLALPNGTVVLPSSSEYATYAADGTTLTQEKCSFDGKDEIGDTEYNWSAVLSYDYTAANASGNLVDTVRQITISISPAVLPEVKAQPVAEQPADGAAAQGSADAAARAGGADVAAAAQ